MTDMLRPLFLFGPGYSATVLAREWPGTVYGSVRQASQRSVLEAGGIVPVALNDRRALMAALKHSYLLISAPPGATGCPALTLLGEQVRTAHHVTYLSTTGVYGDLQGGWAMDWTPPNPGSERAERRLAAETAWHAARPDVCCVRLPGIYGPGRSVFDRIAAGRARRVCKAGQVFSRIHVVDLARGLKALMQAGQSGVFNLCDELAAPPQDVVHYACTLSGHTPPPEIPFAPADLSAMARSFYAECKRVSNAKIKAATGWRPGFASYREGLADIYRQMQTA